MNYYSDQTLLYLDGEWLPAKDATIDLYSQSLHYGYAVFEGIRSYRTQTGQTKIFEAKAHYDRLEASAKALNMPYVYDTDSLIEITYELLKKNGIQNAYIRPLVFAPANMSFNKNEQSRIVIQCWPQPRFLGDQLLRIMLSPIQRPNPKAFNMYAKAAGHYVNSIMASQDAKHKGFDEALLLDVNGFVAEGPGANVFIEKDGVLYTPQLGNILPGITRKCILDLCKESGIAVKETDITVEQLKNADAAFFCGTAAEVVGWKSVDDYTFPLLWEQSISYTLQKKYNELVITD